MFEFIYPDMPDNYTVIDTETTGLNDNDRIVEIAALRVRNGVGVESFEEMVNPGIPISPGASKVNGITNAMVKKCPSFYDIKDKFLSFIGDDVLIGHNIPFDLKFIKREFPVNLNNKHIDTLELARSYVDDIYDYKLSTLVSFFGINKKQTHRALGDVELTQLVFERIKEIILDCELKDLDDLGNYNTDNQLLTIEEIVFTLRGFDLLLQQYDKEIVDYLAGKTRFKKDLIAAAPKIPETIEYSIFAIYKNERTLDKSKFKKLLSIARKRLIEYRLRETFVMRIEAKTRSLREPFDIWQIENRDMDFEQSILKRANEVIN